VSIKTTPWKEDKLGGLNRSEYGCSTVGDADIPHLGQKRGGYVLNSPEENESNPNEDLICLPQITGSHCALGRERKSLHTRKRAGRKRSQRTHKIRPSLTSPVEKFG